MRAIVLTMTLLLSANCNKADSPASESAPAAGGAEDIPASSSSARWVAVQPARDASLLSAPCLVRAQAQSTGEVNSAFRVQVQRVHVQVGDTVAKGQDIVDVVAPEIVAAAASYLGLASRLKVHRERLAALEELRTEGMVRGSAVFELQALVTELSAEMREAAAVLRLAQLSPQDAARIAQSARLTLKAPVDGIVASISAHPGQVLDGATTVATIIGSATARIEVSSPIALVDSETLVMVTAQGDRYPLIPEPISAILDGEAGMHRTWFALEDPSAVLSDGLRCTVEFGLADSVWEVPARAVVAAEEGPVLWRRRDNKQLRVHVKVYGGSGASVLVQGDLKAGDTVAADGSTLMQEAP